jgi:hypothetical protein
LAILIMRRDQVGRRLAIDPAGSRLFDHDVEQAPAARAQAPVVADIKRSAARRTPRRNMDQRLGHVADVLTKRAVSAVAGALDLASMPAPAAAAAERELVKSAVSGMTEPSYASTIRVRSGLPPMAMPRAHAPIENSGCRMPHREILWPAARSRRKVGDV